MTPRKSKKPYNRMTLEELREATAGAENIRFEDTKPLSNEGKRRWDRAKRRRRREA